MNPSEVIGSETLPAERLGLTVRPSSGRLSRWFWAVVKSFFGAFLMQSPAGGIVVAGWLQRFARRSVHRAWWRRSPVRSGDFESFAASEAWLHGEISGPNWVLGQGLAAVGAAPTGLRRMAVRVRWLMGSLGTNLEIGVQTLANVGALTLPGCVLWLVGWWGGWQNSFFKGYEHASVGILVSWLGIMLFIGSLFYVPLAVTRQAVTGRWKSFWDGRTIAALLRVSWIPSVFVAVILAFANWAVMGIKSFPQFIPQMHLSELEKKGLDPTDAFRRGIEAVDWSNLTSADALGILNRYYLGAALVVFLILVGLKRLMAWWYAGAVVRAVQRGVLGEEQLADHEWRMLHTLGLLQVRETPSRPWILRVFTWAGTRMSRAACGVVVFAAWFFFVGAIFVSEFLAYHPVIGWLNQPLIQIPWFRYVPATLEDPSPSLLAAVLTVFAGILVARRKRRPSDRMSAAGTGAGNERRTLTS